MAALGALLGPMLAQAGTWAVANAAPLAAAGLSAGGTLFEGFQDNQNAKFMADQMEKKGDDELALASQEARAKRKEAELANSRNQAVAAGSGAGAGDPTVVEIMGDVEDQGLFNSLTEMYKGFGRKRDLVAEAKQTRKSGRNSLIGSIFDAGVGGFTSYKAMQK